METETTDKPSKHKGIPMTEKELAEYNKTWKDMEEISFVTEKTKSKRK